MRSINSVFIIYYYRHTETTLSGAGEEGCGFLPEYFLPPPAAKNSLSGGGGVGHGTLSQFILTKLLVGMRPYTISVNGCYWQANQTKQKLLEENRVLLPKYQLVLPEYKLLATQPHPPTSYDYGFINAI